MSEPPLPDDLISATEAAQLLHCHVGTVHRWIFKGKMPGYRRLGRWFVSKSDCLALFRKWKQKPAMPYEETPEAKRQWEADLKELRRFGCKV